MLAQAMTMPAINRNMVDSLINLEGAPLFLLIFHLRPRKNKCTAGSANYELKQH